MKLNSKFVVAGILAAGILAGCSMGMQPTGSTVDQIKAKEAAMPPDQQISMIEHSPIPPAEKAKKIAEIKAKAGLK
jgi:hypothetical protein